MRHYLSASYHRVFAFSVGFLFWILWLFNAASGVNAKDIAQDMMRSFAKDNNYSCEGNNFKATCNAANIVLDDTIALKNVKLDTTLNNKNASFNIRGNFQITDNSITQEQKPFIPEKFQCSAQAVLQRATLAQDIKCQLDSPIYTLLINNLLDTQSEIFQSKNLDEVIQEVSTIFEGINEDTDETELKNKFSKFQLNPKQITIQLKGSKLGDSLFAAMKTTQPDMTRESYNSTIALGAAMIPASLAQFKEVSSETSVNLSKAGGAIADVLISRKESAKIILKRKTTTPLNLASLPDFIQKVDSNFEYFLSIFNDYEIISSTQ